MATKVKASWPDPALGVTHELDLPQGRLHYRRVSRRGSLCEQARVGRAPRSAHNVPASVRGLHPKALIVGDE